MSQQLGALCHGESMFRYAKKKRLNNKNKSVRLFVVVAALANNNLLLVSKGYSTQHNEAKRAQKGFLLFGVMVGKGGVDWRLICCCGANMCIEGLG